MSHPPSHLPRRPHSGGRPPKTVEVSGVKWPSISAAATALGYDHRNLAKAIKQPEDSVAYQRVKEAVEKYKNGLV